MNQQISENASRTNQIYWLNIIGSVKDIAKRSIVLMVICAVFGAAFLLGSVIEVDSQGITTSAVSGIVKDTSGKPIAYAQVAVLNTMTGSQTGILTNRQGRFFIQHLQPRGPYRITITMFGYDSANQDGIVLRLGEIRDLYFTLLDSAIEPEQ